MTAQDVTSGPATDQKSLRPTRKWWAATVTAIGAVATLWIGAQEFDIEVQIAIVGAGVQAIVTYLVPNADTPGGVPVKPVGPPPPA